MKLDSLPNTSDLETLMRLEHKINKEVADFFNTKPLAPEISTYENKVDLDKAWVDRSDGEYTEAPDWLVAFATHSGRIHILSADVIPAGFEKSGRTRFSKTLRHEIGHIYTSRINKRAPSWLNEGISLYMAGQDYYQNISPIKITLALLDELEDAPSDGRIYQVGKDMVDKIIGVGGKDLLFKIVGIKDKTKRNTLLKKNFDWLM